MSFSIYNPRTVRNGASFEQVSDGYFPITQRQGASFAGTTVDIGIADPIIRDGASFRKRFGLRQNIRSGSSFIEVFTRSTSIGIHTPLAWFKGDEGKTLVNGAVSQWDDLSGHDRHVTQATPSRRPLVSKLNNNDALDTTNFSRLGFASALTPKSVVFAVDNYQPTTLSSVCVVFGEDNGVNSLLDHVFIRINLSDYTISIDGGLSRVGRASVNNGTLTAGSNVDLGVYFVSGDGPNAFYVDWNDTAVTTELISGFVSNTLNVYGSLHIGEIAFFANDLTEQQRTDIYEKYFKYIWGV